MVQDNDWFQRMDGITGFGTQTSRLSVEVNEIQVWLLLESQPHCRLLLIINSGQKHAYSREEPVCLGYRKGFLHLMFSTTDEFGSPFVLFNPPYSSDICIEVLEE